MVAGAVLFVGVLTVVAWGPFVRFGINRDITDYIEKIEAIEENKDLNNRLVQRLLAIRERVREGHHVGFIRWMDYDTSISAMLNDGVLTESEQARLAGELESIERQQ
jgi:hypothetical protein